MLTVFDLVVLGAAESGVGAARLAQAKGLRVFVSDNGPISPHFRQQLQALGIPFEEGGHNENIILAAHEVVKSPGIPDKVPLIKALVAQGTPVISEIEFALRYTNAKIIGITGSNGKTTTTLLTYHLLKEAGYRVGLAGNVGHSLAAQVITDEQDWYVLELSSFQLDGMTQSRIDIGILLNITPDHLDRYQYQFDLYAASKFRLLQNMRSTDVLIVCPEASPAVADRLAHTNTPAKVLQVGLGTNPKWHGYYAEAALHLPDQDLVIPQGLLPLKGQHNYLNMLSAISAAIEAGLSNEQILAALPTFRNAPHRLEEVGVLYGATWVNDSKATNVDSVYYALSSFAQPIVLILGGVDKGNDYNQIADLVQHKVKALVYMGIDNAPLHTFFDQDDRFAAIRKTATHSLQAALETANGHATNGDVVLLSPACASFDLFRNYEDRGDQFRAWVLNAISDNQKEA